MRCLGFLFALATVGAGCTSEATSPIAGSWRVERTVRITPAGCPSLGLPPLVMTVRPGYEKEIDVGPRQYDGDNVIAGNHVIFTTSEFAFTGNSDMLVIRHDLEIQIGDDRLVGTAAAQGDGANLNCHWQIDAVGSRAAR